MRLIHAIAAASLIAVATAPLAAGPIKPGIPVCEKVFSAAESVWIKEPAGELGTFDGLLNGSFLLTWDDENPSKGPHLFIQTKSGNLTLTLAGDSFLGDDGTWTRKLVNIDSVGDGIFAGAKVDLLLSGYFAPGKGGAYELTGVICTETKTARR